MARERLAFRWPEEAAALPAGFQREQTILLQVEMVVHLHLAALGLGQAEQVLVRPPLARQILEVAAAVRQLRQQMCFRAPGVVLAHM